MAKVIDALVVTLGLDPSGYKAGAAQAQAAQANLKQSANQGAQATATSNATAAASSKKLAAEQSKAAKAEAKRKRDAERRRREEQRQEQAAADATIDRLKGVGYAVAGLVLGFNTVKGALSAYVGATNQLANLGRVAPTIGTDVKSLDKLGDAYKQVGGKADEAGSDIAKLAHAQFSYAINAPDATAGWLRRLGVNPFDDKGAPRDKLQLQEEIAASLKRQTSDVQTQAMYAREIGLSESFIQLYLVKQASERKTILADAEKTAAATEAGAKSAQAQEQAISRVGNRLKQVGQNIVTTVSPGVAAALNWVVDQGDQASATSGERTLKYLGLNDRGPNASKVKATQYDAQFAAAEKKYGLPQGLLKGVAHRESNFDASVVSPAGARGLMQLMPKYFPNAGKDAGADIDTAAKELARLYKYYRAMYAQQTALKLAIGAYNAGQGKLGNALSGKIDPKTGQPTVLKPETKAYVPAVSNYADAVAASTAPTGGGGSTGTTVNTTHIEQLNVHTQATDGQGIAQSLPDALRRQNLVGQANTGLN